MDAKALQELFTALARRNQGDEVGLSFPGADLSGALLVRGNLNAGDFSGACLDRANLSGASAIAARFEQASLRGVTLNGANLTGALLRGADLSEARLEGTCLSSAGGGRTERGGESIARRAQPARGCHGRRGGVFLRVFADGPRFLARAASATAPCRGCDAPTGIGPARSALSPSRTVRSDDFDPFSLDAGAERRNDAVAVLADGEVREEVNAARGPGPRQLRGALRTIGVLQGVAVFPQGPLVE